MSPRPAGALHALLSFARVASVLLGTLLAAAPLACARGAASAREADSGPRTPKDSAAIALFGLFAGRESAEMWRIDSTLRAAGPGASVPLSAVERAVWLDSIAAYPAARPAERYYLPGDARPWIPACVWLRSQLHHTRGDGGYGTFGPAPDTLVHRCRGDAIAGDRRPLGDHWRKVHDPTCDDERWEVSDAGEVLDVRVTCGHTDTHGHRGYGDGHFGKPHEHHMVSEARSVSARQRAIARRLARTQGGQVPIDEETYLRDLGHRIEALGKR